MPGPSPIDKRSPSGEHLRGRAVRMIRLATQKYVSTVARRERRSFGGCGYSRGVLLSQSKGMNQLIDPGRIENRFPSEWRHDR